MGVHDSMAGSDLGGLGKLVDGRVQQLEELARKVDVLGGLVTELLVRLEQLENAQ